MRFFLTAIAFACTLFWLSAADAACVTESRCDDTGVCTKFEICDAVDAIVQSSVGSATSVPATPKAPVAAAVAASNPDCRKVDICGTTQLICD